MERNGDIMSYLAAIEKLQMERVASFETQSKCDHTIGNDNFGNLYKQGEIRNFIALKIPLNAMNFFNYCPDCGKRLETIV